MQTTDLLAQKEKQLDLVMAFDEARDAVDIHGDPNAMFHAIVAILKEFFQADACAIVTLAEEVEEVEAFASVGLKQRDAIQICRQAMHMKTPGPLTVAEWPHTLAMAIYQHENSATLGGLFLARKEVAFNQDEIDLIHIAESQIDSAVIQARTIWNLSHHNIQLEAIYQIDRLRDSTPTESDLIAGFSSVLVEYFDAELCLVFLSHIDGGDMVLRGLVDTNDVPVSALNTIRELTGNISIPQLIQTPEEVEDIALLAAPLIVAGVKLGAVVVGRKAPFTIADHRLLFAMMSQMDSAIVHSRVIQQLQQRNKELETIYRIDQIRDSEVDFDTMLQRVLTELCKAVNSEIGYLMLYNQNEEQLKIQATTIDGLFTSPIYRQAIERISRQALEQADTVYSNKPDGAVRSIIAVPLILNERVLGVFGTVNSANPRGFNAEDRRMLTAITSQVDTAVFERLERRQMRRVLSRSVDPKVLDRMLQRADDSLLTGERVILTVLFADLRGSTEWAEHTPPEELVSTLNLFLGRMTDVIFEYGGTLDKFVGDEVIAIFGSPVPMEDHAAIACRCGLEMQVAHQKLQAELAEQGVYLPAMGVGVSSGEVIAGEFGPPIRTDFTAMGRVMNLGARLCGIASAGQVYISKATCDMVSTQTKTRQIEPTTLKGIGQVDVYELLAMNDD